MRNNKTKIKGRVIVFMLIFSLFVFLSPLQKDTSLIQAASGSYTEDFTTITNMDGTNTNASGWGTGKIENSKKEPTLVGMISSSLIGNTLDVFVEGDYAYVTNQDEGLKVVNITDPTNPNIIGSYVTADIAQSVFVDGDYVFIADYQGISPQYKNFLILDVTDPTNPIHLGNCTTNYVAGDAARDVVVDGDTAFVANNQGGLSVVDVTDPSNPIRIGERDTAGTSIKLAVAGDYVYVADEANGLVVIDISNPLVPTIAATFSTGISSATNIVVEGNYAYVSDINNGIIVVNVTDPSTPEFVGSWIKSDVSDACVYGDYLYVTDINDGLSVVNITDLSTPELIYTIAISGVVQAIDIDGYYVYLACSNGGFQVVQIADVSPNLAGSVNTPGFAYDVFVSGDYAYVADGNVRGLEILNITDPYTPTSAGFYNLAGSTNDVFINGSYAYVVNLANFYVIDISDPSSPTLVAFWIGTPPGDTLGVFVSGDYAYVADGSGGLLVFDISDPSSPTLVGSYDTPNYARDVVVSGDFAYVADDLSGLQILNISDPTSPTFAGSYDTPGSADDVFVSGDYAYVADAFSGLQVIDISDPTSPTLAGSYDTPSFAQDVFVSGNYAYVADDFSGLQVLDISDPTSPTLAGSYDTPDRAFGVFVSGDYAYVADCTSGLQVIDMRNDRARQFDSPSVAQSSSIFSASSSTITSATIIASDSLPVDTAITYLMSADGGSNWETITPGVEHVFSNTGNQLKWKAILTTSNVLISPVIYDLSIDYTTILVAPSLNTPIDGYITDDYTPTFTWHGINGESNYLFQLDTSTSFTTPLLNITLPSSSTSFTLGTPLAVDTYYWRVAGIDSEGDLGGFSSYWTLYLIQDTNAPIINQPSDISYEQGTTGNTITWTPSDSNPYWYNITLNSILTSHDDPWLGGNIVMDIDGLPLGTHIVVCSVYDLEGLIVSDTVDVEVVTTAPPSIDDVTDFPYEEDSTGNSITWHPSDANPDYYSITRDGLIIDDGPWSGGDLNINVDGLAYGVYTYVCFVNDTEGQEASDSVVITVTDNVVPILNSPSDVIYDEGDTGNNIVWIATDNNPATYIVYKDGTLYETDTWVSGSSIIISVDGLVAASYNYTIVVFDEAGNSAKNEVTVAVTPTVPEFSQSVFFAIISITVVFVFYYIKRKTHKKG